MPSRLNFMPEGGRISLAETIAGLAETEREALFRGISTDELEALLYDWKFWARPNQLAPRGDWLCWLVLAGRGFGKTRMGVEWIRSLVEGQTPLKAPESGVERIALISRTLVDARDIVVEGESGILVNTPSDYRPVFESVRKRLVWPNGIKAYLYSSEEPDQLRGPQHHLAWGDELAKWRNQQETWSNLMLGLRLGEKPRVMVTTTPKPTVLLKQLIKDPTTAVTRGSTFENAANLSPDFVRHISRLYNGTRLGRQELYGDLLDDVPGALWSRDILEQGRVKNAPRLSRIVVAVDPPVTHGENADNCGIVVAGKDARGHVYVLADKTAEKLSPNQWGMRALAAYEHYIADRLVAEVNNGGDLVETLIRQLDPGVSYRAVRASRGKIARAEPVAALYERGLVHHAGFFKKLEEELCTYTGERGEKSPDRLDALVWAVTDLALEGEAEPRIRKV